MPNCTGSRLSTCFLKDCSHDLVSQSGCVCPTRAQETHTDLLEPPTLFTSDSQLSSSFQAAYLHYSLTKLGHHAQCPKWWHQERVPQSSRVLPWCAQAQGSPYASTIKRSKIKRNTIRKIINSESNKVKVLRDAMV